MMGRLLSYRRLTIHAPAGNRVSFKIGLLFGGIHDGHHFVDKGDRGRTDEHDKDGRKNE